MSSRGGRPRDGAAHNEPYSLRESRTWFQRLSDIPNPTEWVDDIASSDYQALDEYRKFFPNRFREICEGLANTIHAFSADCAPDSNMCLDMVESMDAVHKAMQSTMIAAGKTQPGDASKHHTLYQFKDDRRRSGFEGDYPHVVWTKHSETWADGNRDPMTRCTGPNGQAWLGEHPGVPVWEVRKGPKLFLAVICGGTTNGTALNRLTAEDVKYCFLLAEKGKYPKDLPLGLPVVETDTPGDGKWTLFDARVIKLADLIRTKKANITRETRWIISSRLEAAKPLMNINPRCMAGEHPEEDIAAIPDRDILEPSTKMTSVDTGSSEEVGPKPRRQYIKCRGQGKLLH